MSPAIPQKMKAARLVKYSQKYEIQEVDVPKIGENDLLLKVGAAGFCHTDYQVYEGVYKSPCPMTPSHEPAGTVVAVGAKAAEKHGYKVGQRVGMLNFRHACNNCVGCTTMHETRFCVNKEMAGITHDGGFAEYVVADADTATLLPDSVPFEQAAPLMCAGATVWAGILTAGVAAVQPMGVIGIGGLGALAIQFCKALGYPVVAIDNRPEGRALATEVPLKADLVIDYNDEQALDKIKQWAGRGGLAGVIVCTDIVPAINWSLKTLRYRGVCVPLGLPVEGVNFSAFDIVFNELRIMGSLVANKAQIDDMMKVVAKFGIKTHVNTVPFDKVPDLPELYMDPHLKGRLVMKM